MLKMKRSSLLIIALTLAVLFSACGTAKEGEATPTGASVQPSASDTQGSGLPLTDKKTTITVMAKMHALHNDLTTMDMVKQLEKDTNVEIKGGFISNSSWQEKKNITLASGELPDMFLSGLTNTDVVKYSGQGYFIPLDELIEENAPNIVNLYQSRPQYKAEATSPDGKQYVINGINELLFRESGHNLFINKKWLDGLGLEIPKTYEEYYEALKAFKTGDPNKNGKPDEIPFSFIYDGGMDYNSFWAMFGGWGLPVVRNNLFCVDDNNKVIYAPIHENFKDALKYFNKLYSDGLMDKEAFTQNSSVFNAKGKNEDAILGSYMDWFGNSVVGAERFNEEYVVLPPMKGPYDQKWPKISGFNSGATVTITNSNKNPELSIKWVNYTFEPLISMQLSRGPIGTVLVDNKDGTYTTKTPPEGMSDDEFRLQYTTDFTFPWALTTEILDKLQLPKSFDRKLKEFYPANKPYLPKNYIPNLMFTNEENDIIAISKVDIDGYVLKMVPQFITGQISIDEEWDSYVNQLKNMKVDEYTKLYQTAYDRYMEAKE